MNRFLIGLLCMSALMVLGVNGQAPGYNWTLVRSNLGQICPGLDFWTPTSGYVLDFISGPGPLLLRTDDGGKTLVPALNGIDILIFVDIITSNNGQNAVTGGVSLAGEPISIQTADGGDTWNKSSTTVLSSTFAAIQVLTDGSIVLFGTWSVRVAGTTKAVNYNGYVISLNNGQTYSFISWPFAIAPVGGSFVGTDFVAVSGSAAPAVPDDGNDASSSSNSLNYHRLLKNSYRTTADFPANMTYRSYIAVSNNAGSTWTTVYSYEGTDNITGVSLGGIQFVSPSTGFVIGANHTAAGSAAFVWGTTNGGSTWATLLEVPGGIFTRIECVSATDCYVLGGVPGGLFGDSVVYYTNNAGKTFSQTIIPKVAAFVDVSVLSPTQMYATAVTAFQTCDLYYYGPPISS